MTKTFSQILSKFLFSKCALVALNFSIIVHKISLINNNFVRASLSNLTNKKYQLTRYLLFYSADEG